jgi:hypothetical protein
MITNVLITDDDIDRDIRLGGVSETVHKVSNTFMLVILLGNVETSIPHNV